MFRDDFELHSHRKTSSNTVTVRFSVWEDDCRNRWRRRNWANVTVGAKCEVTAPLRLVDGAPSLHPQAYEQDLSLVAAHPRMQLPSENALLPNYPNPFNPETWVPISVGKTCGCYTHDLCGEREGGLAVGIGASTRGCLSESEPCSVLGWEKCVG